MRFNVLLATMAGLCIALLGAFTYLHRGSMPLLSPAGPVALGERDVILITFALSGIVVIPVFILLFLFAWLYREGRPHAKRHYLPDWDHYSKAAEITWWTIPTIIIVFLSILAWQSSHALDPYRPLNNQEPLEVEVVSLDWKWLFMYPKQNIASINSLVIPVNTPVHFDLTADSPINSFWIPSLAGQIMVMAGMSTQLNVMATSLGTFSGSSANISGEGFSGMTFAVQSVSKDDFDHWTQSMHSTSQKPLTEGEYATLREPSKNDPVQYFSPIDTSVYASIIEKYQGPRGSMQMTP